MSNVDPQVLHREVENRVTRSHMLGAGPVFVAVFLDFACGRCGHRWEDSWEVLRLRRGLARVAVLPTPLELMGQAEFVGGERWARAAEAAALQGRFPEFVRELFQNQADAGRNRQALRRIAESVNVDAERLERDMESEEVRQAVEGWVELANRAGVQKMPTFLVEGERLEDPHLRDLLAAIDRKVPPQHRAPPSR